MHADVLRENVHALKYIEKQGGWLVGGRMGRWADRYMGVCIGGRMGGWMDGWMVEWMDRFKDT